MNYENLFKTKQIQQPSNYPPQQYQQPQQQYQQPPNYPPQQPQMNYQQQTQGIPPVLNYQGYEWITRNTAAREIINQTKPINEITILAITSGFIIALIATFNPTIGAATSIPFIAYYAYKLQKHKKFTTYLKTKYMIQ